MAKKILKIVRNLFILITTPLLGLIIIYLVNPGFVEEKAYDWFYPTVNIDEKYINKIIVEVPEVYELMRIACTLTDAFQNDANRINRNTNYYLEIESKLMRFKNHELVKKLNKFLLENRMANQTAIRVLSLNYKLENNRLIFMETIDINPILLKLFQSQVFMISGNIDLIESFAKAINFGKFYNSHKEYYSKLIENFNKLCHPDDMKKWLEEKFDNKYQSYRIVFSPLTGGYHFTYCFFDEERNADQAIMFVNAPGYDVVGLSQSEFEIDASKTARNVFTEIDHNYVNPLSENYIEEINSAVPNYKFWNRQQRGYNSNLLTFNEYMTWGVFSLYAIDTYSNQNIDTIITIQTNNMSNRQFIHFKEFNEELIKQYTIKSKPKIDSLYRPMLEWMKEKYFSEKDVEVN
ncbi:MAG: DUF4932 domain-containing protein [Ignavibacteria bacterium]|jgi:hypothetical protein